MKKFLSLVVLSVMLLGLVGCEDTEVSVNVWPNQETIDTLVDEKADTIVADAVISGAMVYEEAKDFVESTTETMDTMLGDMTNSQLESYTGEKVRGSTVLNFIKKTADLASAEILPIPITFEYEDDLSEENIDEKAYYKVEILDTLPSGDLDGFFDLAVISKAEATSVSGE